MDPAHVNTFSIITTLAAGFSWLVFGLTGELLPLIGGIILYLLGFGSFIVYAGMMLEQYLQRGSGGEPAI